LEVVVVEVALVDEAEDLTKIVDDSDALMQVGHAVPLLAIPEKDQQRL
jgi:hypothetical protein